MAANYTQWQTLQNPYDNSSQWRWEEVRIAGEPIRRGPNMSNMNFNLDLNTRNLSINDPDNGIYFNGIIDNEYSDVGVRSNGILDGYIQGNLIGSEFPTRDVPVAQVNVPLFFTHKAVEADAVHIIIVGSGGTGGYVVRDVARYLYSLVSKGDTRRFKINLVDGDKVEEKNLVRQNFIMRDIDQYKSLVLANRYSAAFGIEIEPITEMADERSLRVMSDAFRRNCQNTGLHNIQTLVIGCVDNNKARRQIDRFVRNNHDAYWIDSGNERSSGQIVVGCQSGIRRNSVRNEDQLWLEHNNNFPMPYLTDLYPEVLDESQDHTGDDGLSCADRAVAEEQNIFVNMTAAVHVTNFVRQIVARESMPCYAVEFNIKGVNTVHYNTREEFFNIAKLQ